MPITASKEIESGNAVTAGRPAWIDVPLLPGDTGTVVVTEVTTGAHSPVKWESRDAPIDSHVKGGVRVRLDEIAGNIEHHRIIRIKVVHLRMRPAPDSTEFFFVRYEKPWRFWNGLSSPLLVQFNGRAGDFGIADVSPSLAFGPRKNFDGDELRFLGLEALLSTHRRQENSSKYALSAGVLFDMSKVFQVGALYGFGSANNLTFARHLALVLSVRPDQIAGIGANADKK